MTVVLSLDLSTHTGWCHDGPAGRPLYGVEHFRVDDWQRLGPARTKFRAWLREKIAVVQPGLLVFEAALVFGGKKGTTRKTRIEVVRNQFGLADHTEQICDEMGVPCSEATNNEIKSHWAGNGHADKEEMKRIARLLGLPNVSDDNAVDGIALWSLAKTELGEAYDFRRFKNAAGALFEQNEGGRRTASEIPL